MKQTLEDITTAKAKALEIFRESKAFLFVSCANPQTKTAPKMVVALPDDEYLEISLAFLLANIPKFRNVVINALNRADKIASKFN